MIMMNKLGVADDKFYRYTSHGYATISGGEYYIKYNTNTIGGVAYTTNCTMEGVDGYGDSTEIESSFTTSFNIYTDGHTR